MRAHRKTKARKRNRIKISSRLSILLDFLVQKGLYRKLSNEHRFFILETVFPGLKRTNTIPLLPYQDTIFDDKKNKHAP